MTHKATAEGAKLYIAKACELLLLKRGDFDRFRINYSRVQQEL